MPTPSPTGSEALAPTVVDGYKVSSLSATGCAPPAPQLAHRSHDAHVRDVQIALSDLQLRVPEQQLDLADVEAILEPP
jgi:hypothetical protein